MFYACLRSLGRNFATLPEVGGVLQRGCHAKGQPGKPHGLGPNRRTAIASQWHLVFLKGRGSDQGGPGVLSNLGGLVQSSH